MFDDMIADMESNKKLSPTVTELFLRGRKLNILLVFISQSYFKVPKTIKLNVTHYFIMKIPAKRELQQIALNDLHDIEFKDFMKLCKNYIKETYSFLVNNATLLLENSLRLRRTYYKMVRQSEQPIIKLSKKQSSIWFRQTNS